MTIITNNIKIILDNMQDIYYISCHEYYVSYSLNMERELHHTGKE